MASKHRLPLNWDSTEVSDLKLICKPTRNWDAAFKKNEPENWFFWFSSLKKKKSCWLFCRTWVVPAASGRAASPPLSLVQGGAPLFQLALLQSVRCQVADLQPGELAQEVTERHPEGGEYDEWWRVRRKTRVWFWNQGKMDKKFVQLKGLDVVLLTVDRQTTSIISFGGSASGCRTTDAASQDEQCLLKPWPLTSDPALSPHQ